MKAYILLTALLSLAVIPNVLAQYPPGSIRHRRQVEENIKKEQQQTLETFYKSLPVDTLIRLQPPGAAAGKSFSVTYSIPVKYLKAQKEFSLPKGYRLKNTKVFFTGNGFPMARAFTINKGLAEVDSIIQQYCHAGSALTFDSTIILNPSGEETSMPTTHYIVIADGVKKDTSKNYARQELYETLQHKFTGGTIYFSKAGFPVAQYIPAAEINTAEAQKLIERSIPGTEVVFDNCRYFDKEKKTAVILNKTIRL